MFRTINTGNIIDQNPSRYDVNWKLYKIVWVADEEGVIPKPVDNDKVE